MQVWEIENFRFELDAYEFRIFAESKWASITLTAKTRTLKLDEISSFNVKDTSTTSGLCIFDFSDKYGVSKLQFKKKNQPVVHEVYDELLKYCPAAANQPRAKKTWTPQGVGLMDKAAEKKGLSVEELSDATKVKEANSRIRAEKAETREVAKAASKRVKEEEKAAALEKYGRKIYGSLIQDGILMRRVAIYEKGYAKIGANFEKLRSASGDTQVNKKTGIGRSAATLASFATPFPGFNLLSPGQRGRISLTLSTDRGTHVFSTDQVHESAVRSYQKLLGAAQSVLGQEANEGARNVLRRLMGGDDLPTQLKQLSDLHENGTLDDEEFAKAKAKLLDNK